MVARKMPKHRKVMGQTIRGIRKSAKLSQGDLAEKIGCHRNYVGTVERGQQNLTIDTLVRFAKALKVEPWELLAGYHMKEDS